MRILRWWMISRSGRSSVFKNIQSIPSRFLASDNNEIVKNLFSLLLNTETIPEAEVKSKDLALTKHRTQVYYG